MYSFDEFWLIPDDHSHNQDTKYFHHPQKFLCAPFQGVPCGRNLHLQAQATTDLYPVHFLSLVLHAIFPTILQTTQNTSNKFLSFKWARIGVCVHDQTSWLIKEGENKERRREEKRNSEKIYPLGIHLYKILKSDEDN